MPKDQKAKTASGPSTQAQRPGRLLIIVFGVLAVFFISLLMLPDKNGNKLVKESASSCLQVGSNCFEVERADTNEKRMKGLSGRSGLGGNHAMLFVFETPEEVCMWMKDMRFSIDMLWLDDTSTIKKIKENVAPQTYPKAFCSNDTKYVLEIDAGLAKKTGVKIGDRLEL